ncbi:hypothetical protein BJ508DRAFT_309169 [Ascobolus immersus RN42]|uniref:Uncharacterized protein n=1 Tax=Ascobolus immersus RN42 TaxID=1160509 RepID=A0A3N4HXE7_ASCIM|nr:hypothetical protein BJ508DRAFT_309169 [Ascobolus immersus RN42]
MAKREGLSMEDGMMAAKYDKSGTEDSDWAGMRRLKHREDSIGCDFNARFCCRLLHRVACEYNLSPNNNSDSSTSSFHDRKSGSTRKASNPFSASAHTPFPMPHEQNKTPSHGYADFKTVFEQVVVFLCLMVLFSFSHMYLVVLISWGFFLACFMNVLIVSGNPQEAFVFEVMGVGIDGVCWWSWSEMWTRSGVWKISR